MWSFTWRAVCCCMTGMNSLCSSQQEMLHSLSFPVTNELGVRHRDRGEKTDRGRKYETEHKNNNVSLKHKAGSDDTVPLLPIHLAVSRLITCMCVCVASIQLKTFRTSFLCATMNVAPLQRPNALWRSISYQISRHPMAAFRVILFIISYTQIVTSVAKNSVAEPAFTTKC